MDQIVVYLEKLGYQVEEQGKLKKFLIILKDGLPVGFILPDFSVKTINGSEQDHRLQDIVRFVRENQDLPIAGSGTREYIIAGYRGSKMTTFYDLEAFHPRYALYLQQEDGSVETPSPYDRYEIAIHDFVSRTGMIADTFVREPLLTRWRRRRVERLQKKL